MSTIMPTPPVILTIAGSDSGGGAGIQADTKTISLLGGFAVTVIAGLTAQNGAEVRGIHEVPADFVVQQLETVQDGFPIRAAKTGMLVSRAIIEALAPVLAVRSYPLVIDPVCVSQSGHQLLRDDAVGSLVSELLPLADVLTPNIPEAELLAGMTIASSRDVPKAMEKLLAMGPKAVLLKGGHLEEFSGHDAITDWLGFPGQAPVALTHSRVSTVNNHGTGCTLSAAMATFLGLSYTMTDAVAAAQDYISRALATAFAPGIGAGPPNFMVGRRTE